MLFKVDDSTPFYIQAETTLKTNFFATRNVCTELLPIMKPHGKPSVGLMSLRKQPQVPTGVTLSCYVLMSCRVENTFFFFPPLKVSDFSLEPFSCGFQSSVGQTGVLGVGVMSSILQHRM